MEKTTVKCTAPQGTECPVDAAVTCSGCKYSLPKVPTKSQGVYHCPKCSTTYTLGELEAMGVLAICACGEDLVDY